MFGFNSGSKKEDTPPNNRGSHDASSAPVARLTAKQSGQFGEDAAAAFLQQNGYKIIERNWRPGNALRGEIDAIAWARDARGRNVLCFVEVKTRSSRLSSSLQEKQPPLRETAAPQEAVTISKQRQIARLANAYVSIHRLDNVACRFDVVEVRLDRHRTALCNLCVNAFDYQY